MFHRIIQKQPGRRIVYVDNDPVVLAHARALLTNTTPEGVTAHIEADYHEPELIISDARNVLSFNRPIAVTFMGVLGHARDYESARSIVARVMAAVSITQWRPDPARVGTALPLGEATGGVARKG